MSMKPGQIVREGLPNAAFEPFRDREMSVSRVLPPLEPAYDALRESIECVRCPSQAPRLIYIESTTCGLMWDGASSAAATPISLSPSCPLICCSCSSERRRTSSQSMSSWSGSGRGLVVNPETVSQRVKLLRDAIGDDPRDARYIAGVRGLGYRLLPNVAREEASRPADSESAKPDRVPPSEPPSDAGAPGHKPARRLSTVALLILGIMASAIGVPF